MKTKIATVVSVLFLVIFTSGAFMFVQTFEEHYKKTIADQQLELVSKIAADIDTQVREAQKVLVSVSKLIPTGSLRDYHAMQKQLENITETRFFLKNYFDNGILLYSKTGRVIAEVPYSQERYGKDFSNREYLQYTIRTRTPYISKPYRSTKPPYDPIVMFTAPVFNGNNELVAILGGAVSLAKDTTLGGIAQVKIGRTGYMYLYNSDRTVIVHPDKRLILQDASPRGTNSLFDKAIYEWFEGTGETNTPGGQRVLGTFKHFRNTDWILAAHYPLKDAYGPLSRARWYIVAYTALGIAFCVLITLIVMRKNLSPLSELASQAEEIGKTEESLKPVNVDAGGEIGALASSFNAMLERLSGREESLKKTMDELRKLYNAVEHSSAVILITDTEGGIEYVNPKFVQVTGYERAEALGKTPRILKSGDMPSEIYEELWKTIKSGEEWRGIFHNKKKNGEFYWAASSISPVKDTSGSITNLVGIQEDITAIKLFEQELQKAKAAAESANQAKSYFLASMSHEIRTPMNAIIGMTEILLDGPLDGEQKKYVETLRSAGENLLNIINDILDISKIEAGYLELESVPFDLKELLDAACGIMSVRTSEKGIDISCMIMPDVPVRLKGDPGRLRQVLLNLIGNAVKFTEEGGIRIEAALAGKDLSAATIQFSINDTGIGIPEEKIDGIFEKFTQADPSTTRKYGGTGLGLTISQHLVELMGGKIWVSSTPGVGSTFYFTVLLGIEDERTAGVSTVTEAASTAPAASSAAKELKPLRILLVDDSGDNRLLVQSFLKKTPFTIDTAENGNIAVEKFKDSAYDIILMDMQMPVMDGYEATRQIRRWEQSRGLKKTPVLALTAYALLEEVRKCQEAGCSGHLAKPIKKQDLLNAIMEHTKERPADGINDPGKR
ncbi:MAG TPA: ATP-binding protein [Syntrophorhabdaceae bacterium]|nr:ATP-binding protein [Syntrophorhabdaceae bacterium]